MKKVLELIVSKYAVEEFDWMNYRITKENPLTYHHIKKKEFGGKETFKNGAPLTLLAQQYLHLIEDYDMGIYLRINRVLRQINEQGHAPNHRQQQLIELLLVEFETKYYEELKRRFKTKKHSKYNPTLIRRRKQENGYSTKDVKKNVKKRKAPRTIANQCNL